MIWKLFWVVAELDLNGVTECVIVFTDKEFPPSQVDAAKREIELIMKKHVDTLAELTASKYISKKGN